MTSIREFHAATHKRLAFLMEHVASMPAELHTRALQGFGRPTIAKQFNHILFCESAWVDALKNRPERVWDHEESRLATLMGWRRDVADRTVVYLSELPADDLQKLLPAYPDQWVGVPRTPSFILHHILTHTFHHKGQIVAMCRILGHPAPDTDLQQG
ncbi:MAG: DinB family protein [Bryobacteraceae bacterium]|nr:DinB family protein [Bryobacteraceae bacterium]